MGMYRHFFGQIIHVILVDIIREKIFSILPVSVISSADMDSDDLEFFAVDLTKCFVKAVLFIKDRQQRIFINEKILVFCR